MIDTSKYLHIAYHVLAPAYCVFPNLHCTSVTHTLRYYALRITYCVLSIAYGDLLVQLIAGCHMKPHLNRPLHSGQGPWHTNKTQLLLLAGQSFLVHEI